MSRLNLKEEKVIQARIDSALGVLMEHCDSVQILASYMIDSGNTCTVFAGKGNWYARTGMAREFLSRDDAQNVGVAVENCSDHGEEL
jgi:hypothetical protein